MPRCKLRQRKRNAVGEAYRLKYPDQRALSAYWRVRRQAAALSIARCAEGRMRNESPLRVPVPGRSFVMAGGGTGGHVIPALAVARELRKRGHNVFFVGTERGIEGRWCRRRGLS